MADRAKVVVRVRRIAEDQATGVVALAQQQAASAAQRADDAHARCHVHPIAAMGTSTMTAGALAMSAGSAAALLSAARSAADAAQHAAAKLAEARALAARARAARMAAERLADRREQARVLEEERAGQRNVDEMVSSRHSAGAR
jgi:flagellar export protein FliJ